MKEYRSSKLTAAQIKILEFSLRMVIPLEKKLTILDCTLIEAASFVAFLVNPKLAKKMKVKKPIRLCYLF